MDNLRDLAAVLRGLTGDKAMERKKCSVDLRDKLSESSVGQALTVHSEERQRGSKGQLTWDAVLKAVISYVHSETEALQKLKENVTALTHASRDRKKHEVSSLFKLVIKTAQKWGGPLKTSILLGHIVEVMKGEYTCAAFGTDYSNVLLKHVLTVRQHYMDISSKTWHELLLLYCQLFLDADSPVDHSVSAHLVKTLITLAAKQCDLQPKRLLLFFTQVFKNIREDNKIVIMEHLVSALNVCTKAIAPGSRVQICKLGETVLSPLLYLWSNSSSDSPWVQLCREEIVAFVKVQMEAHHPCGARHPDAGAFAVSWDDWKSHLGKLYEVIVADIENLVKRLKCASGMKNVALKESFIELAADVFYQLFTEEQGRASVTATTSDDDNEGTPAKRRRLMSGWATLLDNITTTAGTLQMIPWLQLLRCVLDKYPTSLILMDWTAVLNSLHQTLTACKGSEMYRQVFGCLVCLADSVKQVDLPKTTTDSMTPVWLQVWTTCLSVISSRQAASDGYQDSGFQLLTAMLRRHLVSFGRQVWNLFLHDVTFPTPPSLTFLSTILTCCQIPENFLPSILGSRISPDKGSFPLRKHLIDWVLYGLTSRPDKDRQDSLQGDHLARLLVQCVVRDPAQVGGVSENRRDFSTALERLYLLTTFHCELSFEKGEKEQGKKKVYQACHAIPALLVYLKDRLNTVLQAHLQLSDSETSTVEQLAYDCSLLSHLHVTTYHHHLTLHGIPSLLKQLLNKLTTSLSECVKKGTGGLLGAVECLQCMLSFNDPSDPMLYQTAEMVRGCFPAKLVNLLTELVHKKLLRSISGNKTSKSDSSSLPRLHTPGSSRSSSRIVDRFDDFDDLGRGESSAMEVSGGGDGDLGFEDICDGRDSQDADDNSRNAGCGLLELALSDNQCLRNKLVLFLCQLTGFDRRSAPCEIQASTFDVICVKTKIQQVFSPDNFDIDRTADIQLVQQALEILLSQDHHVTDTDLDTIMDVLGRVVRGHRHNQEVCCLVLSLLCRVTPHLSDVDDLPSQCVQESREMLLHLISAFWRLQSDGQYNSQVRLHLAKCMAVITQHDPDGQWGSLKLSGGREEDEGEKVTVAGKFPHCLIDGSLVVRLFMADSMNTLFLTQTGGRSMPKSKEQQHAVFDQLYEICNDMMDIQGRLSAERLQDERWCRSASLLLVLSSAAMTSTVCEKKALFALCLAIEQAHVEVHLVSKVMKKMSGTVGYQTPSSYVCSHLPYLVSHWLKLDCELQVFPYTLLGCDTLAGFYSAHYKVLVPHLFMRGRMDAVQSLADALAISVEEVLRNSLPAILVHILPVFAAAKSQNPSANMATIQRRLPNANTCYDALEEQLGKETIERNIVNQMGHIVVRTLACLSLNLQHRSQDGVCEPESNPPSYNEDVVRQTLDYLTHSLSSNTPSLVAVLAKSPDGIEQVLLELCVMMAGERRGHERLRCLQMFALFVNLLLQDLPVSQLGGSRPFVLRRVVATLMHVLSPLCKSKETEMHTYEENIIQASISLLRDVMTAIIECCPEELCHYLCPVVDVLCQLGERGGEVGESALLLLHYLLIDKVDVSHTCVLSLDPLPPLPAFTTLAKHCQRLQRKGGCLSLDKLVERVVSVSRSGSEPPESFARTLQLLTTTIDNHRKQLATMVTCDSGSESGGQVLCELLRLTQSSVQVVAEEAGRCLGAIGPVTLMTAALPHPLLSPSLTVALSVYKGTPFEKYCHVFHRLNQYLVDPSIAVVQKASETLKKLLSTAAGAEFSADYKDKLANRDFLFHYLHPFRPHKHSKTPPSSGREVQVQQLNNNTDTEGAGEGEVCDHATWIKQQCSVLLHSGAITDPILSLLQPVWHIKTEFCEMLLPYLVHDVLSNDVADQRALLSHRIAGFFNTHCRLNTANGAHVVEEEQGESSCVSKESVLTMLQVVNYLRTQTRPDKGRQIVTAWDNNFWLDLNYLDVAWAAHNCDAHFSAILFAEIWCDSLRQSDSQTRADAGDAGSGEPFSQTSLFSNSCMEEEGGVQSLLREALRCVGDPDAVYGCGVGALPDSASRVETYVHERQWDKAVVTLDIQMQQSSPSTQLQLFKAVQQYGGDYILGACLEGLDEAPHPDMTELRYQAAWRAGQWDLDLPPMSEEGVGFHQCLYSGLYTLRDKQPSMALHILHHARQSLLTTFDVKMESCRSVYPLLSRLQCLRQFELLVSAISSEDKTEALDSLLRQWQDTDTASDTAQFEFLEAVYSLRVAGVRLLAVCGSHPGVDTALQNILMHTADTARKAGFYQLSERCLHEVQHQTEMSMAASLQSQLQLAQLFWARNEQTTAKHVLKSLISRCRKDGETSGDVSRLLTKSLSLYGNWLSETRSETPSVIMEQYLEKTVQLLESSDNNSGPEAVDAYFSLARFADTQYQNIVNYMNSPTFEAKQALMKKAAAEYQKYTAGGGQKDRYLTTLQKQCKIDQQEVSAMTEDRKRFLHHAVRCYASCLQHGDAHDLRVFRLTSLWFDNSTSPLVNDVLEECSQKLKSYKFLPLMHQLAARMSCRETDNPMFLSTLNTILKQAAVDHPHHTLWVLLALANANKDEEIVNFAQSAKRRGKLATGKKPSLDTEDRVKAAQMLLEDIKTNSRVGHMVRDMETLAWAYMELANWDVTQYKKETRPVPLPRSQQLLSVKNLSTVAVPTLELKVDPSCCYDNIVSVVFYQSTFRLAGGVNLPKIITCHCSDGIDRRQLVKGKDDLRQDAVMQQVFGLVNRLLSHDPATSARQLHIRTYKVVPLSRCSGLLQWCEGTRPLGEYLIGQQGVRNSGAHSRYRPKDWSAIDCRKKILAVANASSPDIKYEAYMEACHHFQPVFRFFFMETFLDPAHWFQCRLAYTRSVATNSIVGYILGLGDRHVMNILIDCVTAELIHIDLGIAFEQGHILPTPETVPFRLTRDIVDGMGVTGVEGVFRRCCEKTMEVMRVHQESLMTIVQVLLYDPLSAWTLSPQRAYALQGRRARQDCDTADISISLTSDTDLDLDGDKSGEGPESVNKLAERVLLRLRQKLQGLEDGVALSVAGQVNHLIQTARDPRYLSRLFHGWQAYI